MMISAPNSARLAERFGVKRVVAGGLAVVGVGLLLMSMAGVDSGYGMVVVPLVILAAGMGSSMAPATSAIMASLPLGKAGVGSAVNDTTRELGGALGVAVLGSLSASAYASGVSQVAGGPPGTAAAVVRSSLGGALEVGRRIGGPAGDAVVRSAQQAYVDGMSTGLRVAAAVSLIASLVVLRYLPSRVTHGEDPTAS
jgi:MFS family permease